MPELRDDQKLTLLATALRNVLLTNDPESGTLWDRLLEVGVPVDDLFADVKPFASPPYSPGEFRELLAVKVT